MITVPYLILFFAALGMQIVAYKKNDDKISTRGHIIGAVCGLYITFIVWLYAGFGASSSYSALVKINGMPLYFGSGSILPVVIIGFILTPLLSWLPRWIAYLLTHFITYNSLKKSVKKEEALYSIIWNIVVAFLYFCIGSIPLILMLHETQYSHNQSVIDYLSNEFLQFSFCGTLLAIWLLVGVRYIANVIVSIRNKEK